jgi:CRISPR-associated endonuclease/helicase Cas3
MKTSAVAILGRGGAVEFCDFFKQATEKAPYAYQRRLAEQDWPEVLIAPTGLGKTAAIVLAWLWRRRIAPEATPRRLVYCLPMRTLVEQTEKNISTWLQRLAHAGLADHLPDKNSVHVLMGGMEKRADRDRWDEAPEQPAILIGTQDMLLSRALMRGYASGRARWPVEFALLHNDAQWVFDEVQLMGAGLPTSVQLEAFRSRLRSALPSHSLWISATLDPKWLKTVDFDVPQNVLRVPIDVPEDAISPDVQRLIEADKPLSKAGVAPAGEKKAEIESYIHSFADLLRTTRVPGQRSLAIVNTVDRARMLYQALLKSGIAKGDLILVHSRFRPGDRDTQMKRLLAEGDEIVVATQAIEAGVDISSAVLVTELAPWPSLVQRFGRTNRRGERSDAGGSPVYWIDLPAELAPPYDAQELDTARSRLAALSNVAPVHLGHPGGLTPARRVIRQKDLIDLFDTDPDLTGFDVDISPYVRDADDTDVRVFWRDLDQQTEGVTEPLRPSREELCAVSIGRARDWVKALGKRKIAVCVPDPQWRKGRQQRPGVPPGWQRLDGQPWPGLTLLVKFEAGGYSSEVGFLGDAAHDSVQRLPLSPLPPDPTETDQVDGDQESNGPALNIATHTDHVFAMAKELCTALSLGAEERDCILQAARWHDVGKAHEVFQKTMHGDGDPVSDGETVLLAKSGNKNSRHSRPYFRHELASALAFLAHKKWCREADFIAYLIVSHHGKVRMSLRALPAEKPPQGERASTRFARGVWENDQLPAVDLGDGVSFEGGALTLSVMEIGEDEITGASWTERTHALLEAPAQSGPTQSIIRLARPQRRALIEARKRAI